MCKKKARKLLRVSLTFVFSNQKSEKYAFKYTKVNFEYFWLGR